MDDVHVMRQELESLQPRVLNKLRLGFDPLKPFHPDATKLNGLSNEMLSDQKPFEDSAPLLNWWLRHLSGPVCVVAYNGAKYDFPLLKAEFRLVLPPWRTHNFYI